MILTRYIPRESSSLNLKKIDRSDLQLRTITLQDEAIGYSVSQRRNLLGEELKKSPHTAIIGASGSGKTVLLDALIYDSVRKQHRLIA